MSAVLSFEESVCPACGRLHRTDVTCAAKRDALWGLLRDRGATGRVHDWAEVSLFGVEDEQPAHRSAPTGHTCGFAERDGVWTCVQDYYATGDRPETGCGGRWRAALSVRASELTVLDGGRSA